MQPLVVPYPGKFIFFSLSLNYSCPSSGISVISKATLLSEFKQLCLKMCQSCNIHMSYNQLKKLNKEYFQKKQAMITFLEQANFGYWSADKIHFEQFKYSSNILPIIRNN